MNNAIIDVKIISKGPTGIQGEKGDTGNQGVQGYTGEKGDKGDKGDAGINGVQSADIVAVSVKTQAEYSSLPNTSTDNILYLIRG